MVETATEVLVPSWWEIEVTLAASLFVIFAYWFFSFKSGYEVFENSSNNAIDDKDKVNFLNDKVISCPSFLSSMQFILFYFSFMIIDACIYNSN